MTLQVTDKRVVPAKRGGIARIGIESQPVLAKHRYLFEQVMRLFEVVGQRTRLILARLDIRLVEGINANDRASHGGRYLPAEEFLAYVPDVLHADTRDRMASSLQRRHRLALQCILLSIKLKGGKETVVAIALGCCHRLVCERDQPATVLARAFRQKLFQPSSEIGDSRRRNDRDLVAAEARGRNTHGDTELYARILRRGHIGATGSLHRLRRLEETFDVDTHRRCRHQTELREHGVASADHRYPMEDMRKAKLLGASLQR